MKFVKSNHRATLKNEHLRELIHTALTTYCPGFRGLENQTKISYWQLLYIIWCKTCIFTVFVLILQTGFAVRWCFWFSANDSSIEQVCPPLVYTICKEAWVKKKHCCQWSTSCASNAPSEGAQMCSTTNPFVQNLISYNFQDSKPLEKHENKEKLFELNGTLFVFS